MGLPLHIQKLDSGAIRVWIGDHISSTATVAIPTAEGLVIIDTTGNPEVDRELRRIIARELGRDEFTILINTHEHGDHTGGNGVYSDCTIVGHELVAEGMASATEDRHRIMDWYTNRIPELEAEIAQAAADDSGVARLREELVLKRLELKVLQANDDPIPPTKTFKDQLVLDLGDTTFELYYIGGMHSASDIAIFVPEHGLLMTGDTMADVWLTDTPGCLASFGARAGIKHDFALQLANWNTLLAKKDAIKTLLRDHWNGELTHEGCEARVRYVEALWEGAKKADAAGTGLEAMLVDYSLPAKFPALVESPGFSGRTNYLTVIEVWTEVTSQLSAAAALYDLIDQGADDSAIRQVVDARGAKDSSHFFIEAELNGYGYRFLQGERAAQAATMFKINVELFPNS